MSFPPYPKYKASGVEWLGDVPDHWNVSPMKAVAEEVYESNRGMRETNLLSLSYGRIVRKNIESNEGLLPESFETYQIVNPGEIIFRPTDLQNDWTSLRTAIVEEKGIITSAYIAVASISAFPRYLNYLYRAYDHQKVFYSMGGGLRQSLKYSDLKYLPMLVPPYSEQVAIAEFLDRETGKIDELVAEQRRLIELLKEKRQAVISHAVTRGLNPDAPLKPSGIQWLGNIPEHWELLRLRRLFEIKKRIAGTLGFDVFSITQNGFRIRDTENFEGQLSMDYSKYQLVYPGDFAMNPMDLITGGADVAKNTGVTSPDYRVFSLREAGQHSRQFLLHVFNYCYRKAIFFPFGQGSSQLGRWRFPRQQFNDFVFPIPPKSEQDEIVEYLENKTTKFDALTAEAERAIELLQERRTALISAAVTGKIDVRGLTMAPKIP